MNGISVIICCYNSELRLPETLRHLAMQQIKDIINWEIIVVNNNSNDSTVEVARKEWSKYNCSASFKVIDVPEPGKSHAIKAAVFEAKYKYSIICDDDNWLNSDYLQIAFEIMESNDQIGMLGGQGIAICEIEAPDWFEIKKEGYAIGPQSAESGDVTQRGFLWGAGVIFRTIVLNNIYRSGIKSLLTCRKGNELSSGGDSEISLWFMLVGYKLWYDSRLIFKHFIPKERLTEDYVIRLFEGFELSQLILIPYQRILYFRLLNLKGKTELFSKALLKIILGFIYPSRFKFHYTENIQYIQLILGSVIIFDSELATVQNMLRKPLRSLKKENKLLTLSE